MLLFYHNVMKHILTKVLTKENPQRKKKSTKTPKGNKFDVCLLYLLVLVARFVDPFDRLFFALFILAVDIKVFFFFNLYFEQSSG